MRNEVMFDVKVKSEEVFHLNGFTPKKTKDSAQLQADLVLTLDREEKDVLLGRDMKFAEDRTKMVLAGKSPTMTVEVANNEAGRVELRAVVNGTRCEPPLCVIPAVLRKARLTVTEKSVRLVLRARVPLDDVTCILATHTKSDLHVTWLPAQTDMKFEGKVPGEDDGVDEDGDVLPPEPEDDQPTKRRGRARAEA